jgi:hypothetical protein
VTAVIDRLGDHAARVAAKVRFGQAEAADQLGCGHAGQVLVLLVFGAEFPDGEHGQRALHADEAAHARVAALQLLAGQPIGDIRHAGAAIAVQVHAQQAHLADLRDEVHGEGAGAAVLLDDGDDLVIHPASDEIPHHALVFAEV